MLSGKLTFGVTAVVIKGEINATTDAQVVVIPFKTPVNLQRRKVKAVIYSEHTSANVLWKPLKFGKGIELGNEDQIGNKVTS